MRKLGYIAGLIGWAGVALADPAYVPLEVSIGTNAAAVVTATANPRGYLDEILIQAPSRASTTSDVSIISVPGVGTAIKSTVLYTNAAMETVSDVIRPRVVQDNNTGAALSSLTVAERFLCCGDPITLRVAQTSTVTGVVYKVWLKIERD